MSDSDVTSENFWDKDLAEVEAVFLGDKKITDLSIEHRGVNGESISQSSDEPAQVGDHPALHFSAPKDCQCADCFMDKEPCPTCYSVWHKNKYPNTIFIAEPQSQGECERCKEWNITIEKAHARLVELQDQIANLEQQLAIAQESSREWQARFEKFAKPDHVFVPIEPSIGLLVSMAIRYDHGLTIPGYYDQELLKSDVSHAQRFESTITIMRQLYEEISGKGFYKSEKETEYCAQHSQSKERE